MVGSSRSLSDLVGYERAVEGAGQANSGGMGVAILGVEVEELQVKSGQMHCVQPVRPMKHGHLRVLLVGEELEQLGVATGCCCNDRGRIHRLRNLAEPSELAQMGVGVEVVLSVLTAIWERHWGAEAGEQMV